MTRFNHAHTTPAVIGRLVCSEDCWSVKAKKMSEGDWRRHLYSSFQKKSLQSSDIKEDIVLGANL